MARGSRQKVAKVILISNPLSTRNQKFLPTVRAVLDDYPEVVHLEGGNFRHVYKRLKEYKGTSPELLIINGGDGTIHTALTYIINNKIFKTMPLIAVLGGGMTNMIAKDLNTGERPNRALEKILACSFNQLCKHHTKERKLIRAQAEGEKTPVYGLFFGGASMVNVMRYCTRRLYSWGFKGKIAQLVALFLYYASRALRWGRPGTLGYSPFLRITLDSGKKIEGRFSSLIATTLHRLIFATRAPVGSDGFTFYTLKPSFWSMVSSLVEGAFGTIEKTRNKGITIDKVKKVIIEGGYPFTLDGEIYDNEKGRTVTLTHTLPLRFVSFN